MPRGKQVVKKGIWYVGGKKKRKQKQKGKGFPFGLVASAAAPFLSEIAKPIFKKIFGGKINIKIKGLKRSNKP